ncbi:MAG: hypothetical protein WCI59_05035 [Betaproteobacteria bacterium]
MAHSLATSVRQDIRVCTTSDGVRLAMALYGSGPPLVKAATWLTHDGDCKDIILEAGQRYDSAMRARLLVHALEAAQVRLAR